MTLKPAAVVLVALTLLASACGGSGSSTPAATETSPTAASSDIATAVPINEDSPIESLLGVPVFDDDAMNDWFRELDIERQQKTAECMIAEGFEFVPETSSNGVQAREVEFATNSREYAANYGFGIGHAFNAAEFDPNADYSTANSTYVASLTDGEREAYYAALHGADSDVFEDGADTDDIGLGSGCEGDAFRDVFEVLGVMFELSPIVDGYYEQFLADSRMIELTATWQRCMSEGGFLHDNPDDMADSFYGGLDELISQPSIYEEVVIPDDLPDQPEVFFGDTYSRHPKLTADGQAQLDAFIANEIATAVAHWDCREPLIEDELAIQREYEALFVAEAAPLVNGG